jgi:endoglucanase
MKTTPSPLVALLGSICLLTTAQAQNSWYLHGSQSSPDNWNTPGDWYSAPSGGTAATTINATDNYYENGFTARTPDSTSASTFGGLSLTLNGGGLFIKDDSSTTVTAITNLISNGSTIQNSSGGTQIFDVTNFNNVGATALNSGGTTRNINLTIGTLSGNGNLDVVGGGIIYLSVTSSAATFLGNIYTDDAATLTLQTNLTFGGSLMVGSGTVVVLNGSVNCAGLVVSGTTYAAGTYSFATLNAAYPSIFTSGTGSITVRTPADLYLHASQGGNDNWNTLTDWFTTPTGGTNPPSINPSDDFFTNNDDVRTPNNSSPAVFGGATLTMDGGGVLIKATSGTALTTIGNFVSTGGTIAAASTFEDVAITNFNNESGTATFDSDANNRGFNLTVGTLVGDGAITFLGRGGATLDLSVTDASNYTGTLTLSSSSTGTLTFTNPLFSAGSLDVGSGNTVVLNQAVTFTGLTVGSTVEPPGTYSASSLGFTGSGSLTVKPHPAQMFGVDFSGLEDDSGIYPPAASDYEYFGVTKGLKLVRLPFTWERMQPTLNGALSSTYLADVDAQVSMAASDGMQIILDVHNYDRYNGNLVGSADVPYSAFENLWTQLATHYAGNTTVYGYDIMNEPNGTGGTWPTAAQDAVNAIRAVDTEHFILVEGDSYSSADVWGSSNPGLPITDSANRTIYEAHCYFSNANDDSYGTYAAEGAYPDKGVLLVAPFVAWLKVNHQWGMIGEYGVPKNDSRWNVVLNNFMKYIQENGLSGTDWAGPGFNPASYQLGIEPTDGVDAPQMSVLELYTP